MSKNLFFQKRNIIKNEIDLALLIETQQIIAKLIELYGDRYLPAFIRVHNEIDRFNKGQSYRTIALQMVSNKA